MKSRRLMGPPSSREVNLINWNGALCTTAKFDGRGPVGVDAVEKVPNCSAPNLPAAKNLTDDYRFGVASITLPRLPASFSSGSEVPRIFTRKSRVRPKEILITTAKRLFNTIAPRWNHQQLP
jgi:hypothetical protein